MDIEQKMNLVVKGIDLRSVMKDTDKCFSCKESSIIVTPKNYLCPICHICGDAISYLMETRAMSLEEATDRLYGMLERYEAE
jgi:hypothetical protein